MKTSPQMAHLDALNLRLSHGRGYLAQARTEGEKALRLAWIAQIEKEITRERAFLGLSDDVAVDMSDDELLTALEAS